MTGTVSQRPSPFPGDKEALTREAFVGQLTADDSLSQEAQIAMWMSRGCDHIGI